MVFQNKNIFWCVNFHDRYKNKKTIIVFLLVLFVFFSKLSLASQKIDQVRTTITGPNSVTYQVSWRYMDPPLDWYNLYMTHSKGLYGLAHRHYVTGGVPVVSYSSNIINTVSTETYIEGTDRWESIYGKTGYINIEHTGSPNAAECIGFIITDHGDNSPWSQAYTLLNCEKTEPADNWCKLKTPEITLDFGVLQSDAAVGTTRQGNVVVECTTEIDYVLILRGKDNIALNNGMNVSLKAAGQPLGTNLHGEIGDNNIVIEGTLNGTPKDGTFSGSEVLIVDYI